MGYLKKMEKCENCERLKKLLKIHIDDLRKYVEKDKEFKKALTEITTTIISEKVEKPKSWYDYSKFELTAENLAKWYEATENFYHFAKRFESQERGSCCSVDRAYRDWLIPECKKLLDKLKEVSANSSHK